MMTMILSRLPLFGIVSIIAFTLLPMVLAQPASAELQRRVCTWAAIGPFAPTSGDGMSENFLSSQYSEASAFPYLGLMVNGNTWELMDDRTYCRNHDDYNDFYTFYHTKKSQTVEGRVCYAGAYIYVPSSGTYRIHFGANDKAKMYVNGQCIIAQLTSKQAKRDTYKTNYFFNEGWNRVLIKVYNDKRIFGFYFNLTGTDDNPISNLEICPHDPGPGDQLAILNDSILPKGYQHSPYVHLDVTYSGSYPNDNPSASPFKFVGRGGTPPYTFDLYKGLLPQGLSLNTTEGELLTTGSGSILSAAAIGTHNFTIRMRDSSSPQKSATKTFSITVEEQAGSWMFGSGSPRMGALRHGTLLNNLNEANDVAHMMARQELSWCASTNIGWSVFNNKAGIDNNATTVTFQNALNDEDILLASYISFHERWDESGGDEKVVDYCGYLHTAFELFIDQYNVPLFWIDQTQDDFRPTAMNAWELDALYSLVRAKNPDCLILHNSPTRGQDNGLGDIDLVSYEGTNNHGASMCRGYCNANNYWDYWPSTPYGNNPRYLPQDNWRMPQYPDAISASEWLKVIIALHCETGNNSAIRVVNFDHSYDVGDSVWNMHDEVADWLEVGNRKEAIFGVIPGPITDASWGYDVENYTSGDYYLHLTNINYKGKTGFSGGDLTIYGLPTSYNLSRICFAHIPANNLAYTRNGTTLTIHNIPYNGENRDSTSTILWLQQH